MKRFNKFVDDVIDVATTYEIIKEYGIDYQTQSILNETPIVERCFGYIFYYICLGLITMLEIKHKILHLIYREKQ